MKYEHNISPEEIEQIERFINNEMTPEEAKLFAQQLENDPVLQEKTEEIRLLLVGIGEQALEDKLPSFHQELKMTQPKTKVIPMARKLLVAASVTVLIGLAAWWWLGRDSSNEKMYSQYYAPDPGLPTVMGATTQYDFENAMVAYKNGEYEKALNSWNHLLTVQPQNDTLLYFIGSAELAGKNEDRAISRFKIVALDSNSIFQKDACWYLGLAYLKKNDTGLAEEFLRKSGRDEGIEIIKAIKK